MFAEALKVVYHDESPLFTLGEALLEERKKQPFSASMHVGPMRTSGELWLGNSDPSKTPRLWEFGLNDLSEIVFGANVGADAQRAVRSAASYLPSVRFGRMRPAERRDELEVNWNRRMYDDP